MDKYAKAIIGTLIAGLGAVQIALTDDSTISTVEWINIASVTILALGAIWGVPNAANRKADFPAEPK